MVRMSAAANTLKAVVNLASRSRSRSWIRKPKPAGDVAELQKQGWGLAG